MPFVMSKVNVPVNAAQESKFMSRLGKAIEILPGMSERFLLVGIESNCTLYLRGEKIPTAYIEVNIFGNEIHYGYEKFAVAVTEIFVDVLDIPPQNVYVKFCDLDCWGVAGKLFDGAR